jgi:hypothetical protein
VTRVRMRNLLALPALCGVVGLAALAPAKQPDKTGGSQGAHSTRASVTAAAAREDFAVLRGRADQMPASIKQQITKSHAGRVYGADPALARAVDTPVSRDPAWVMPARGLVCLWVPDPVDGGGIGCVTPAQATRGDLVLSLVTADRHGNETGRETVYGLAPDGVTAFTASTAGGRVTAAVQHNIYAFELSGAGDLSVGHGLTLERR